MRKKRSKQEVDILARRVVKAIRKHPCRRNTVEQLACETGVARDFIKRRIKDLTGLSAAEHRSFHRLEYVRKKYSRDPRRSLSAIAREAGFENYQTFYRTVVRFHGKNPVEFFKNRAGK